MTTFGLAAGIMAGAAGATATAATVALMDGGLTLDHVEQLAPGVRYGEFAVRASHGTVHGHVVTVDLRDPRVHVDLLTPGAVATRGTVSAMADARRAVAAVNGDFFDISETEHPGVAATGSSDGPEIAAGHMLKAAVPDAQRFGPAIPPGGSTRDVLGIGADRRMRLDRLTLRGFVRTATGRYDLGGYNQYALPVGGIGAYTAAWGTASRERAVCGSDVSRAAGCSTDTYEVAIRRGRVAAVAEAPGEGAIPPGTTVLLGRDAGADALRALHIGTRVRISADLASETAHVRYTCAVGGLPVLRDDLPPAGLDATTAATRTAAGFGDGGRTLRLLATDGTAEPAPGLTIAELADVMRRLGADDAVDLDGGGSTTMAVRGPGDLVATVRNHLSDGAERPVADAIGVLTTSP